MSVHKSSFANLFFLAVLFPYISPVPTPFDVQPYTLLAALVILAAALYSGHLKLPVPIWLLGVPSLYAMGLLWLHGPPNFAGLRAVSGYLSVFGIAAATYLWMRYFSTRLFAWAVFIWLAVALIQRFIYRDFGGWILPRFAPDYYQLYRGVTSLATEPSHYAGVCFFFLLFNELFYSYRLYAKRQYVVLGLALSVQIVLTFSALGLLFVLLFASLKLTHIAFTRLSPRTVARTALMLLLFVAAGWVSLRNERIRSSRAVTLARIVINTPQLLQEDRSVRVRWNDMTLPLVGFYRSYGTGFGLSSWDSNHRALAFGESPLVRFPRPQGPRIMSGWGTALFELGVFGLALFLTVSWAMIDGMRRDRSRRSLFLLILICIHFAMLNATPLAFPPFAFLIGMCVALPRRGQHRDRVPPWRRRLSPDGSGVGGIVGRHPPGRRQT